MRTWSKMIKGMGALALAGALFTGGHANAAVEHTLNFSDAAAADGQAALGIPNVVGAYQWNFDFQAMSVFTDANNNNLPDPGESFQEWILVKVTDVADINLNPLTGPGTGDPNYRANHEITAAIQLTGTLGPYAIGSTTDSTFVVTGLPQFGIFFDAGTAGVDYTPGTYGTNGTFTDGVLVETGTLISGKGDQDTQTPFDGNLDLRIQLDDKLAELTRGQYLPFELDGFGAALVNELSTFAVGVTTSNPVLKNLTPTLRSDLAAFAGYGGDVQTQIPGVTGFFDGGQNQVVAFVAGSGQFTKEIIPEPVTATMSMMGLGALAAGALRRRRA